MDNEAIIEASVADSVKDAVINANRIIACRKSRSSVSKNEEIGMFITCLRTSLIQRENSVLISLMGNDDFRLVYEKTKIQLFKKENWKGVGVFGEADYSWKKSSSGRFRYQRNYEENMDKSRIASVVSQAKEEVSGFDFNAAFNEMEETLRDMRRLTVQHETLSGQATRVTESLCAVAESLSLDAN